MTNLTTPFQEGEDVKVRGRCNVDRFGIAKTVR